MPCQQVVEGITANGRCALRIRAQPLPASIAALLDDAQDVLRQALQAGQQESAQVPPQGHCQSCCCCSCGATAAWQLSDVPPCSEVQKIGAQLSATCTVLKCMLLCAGKEAAQPDRQRCRGRQQRCIAPYKRHGERRAGSANFRCAAFAAVCQHLPTNAWAAGCCALQCVHALP